jgi:hypothetical protein
MAVFRKSDADVAIGDVFVEANREKTNWRVEFVFGDPNAVPHARLRRIDDPTVVRTFAAAVLLGDPRFRRLARRPQSAEAES